METQTNDIKAALLSNRVYIFVMIKTMNLSPVEMTADTMVFVFASTLSIVYGVSAPLAIIAGGSFGAILHEDALSLGQVEL